ncbi:MAG: hypothetical protein Q7U28_13480 [Aquabacterium sp.]|nr:hypothetical protein [Aquabacterium sp.]
MTELARRPFLNRSLTGLAALSLGANATAAPRPGPRADSPLVGIDPVFIESGLTARWQAAMKQDLGWSARWAPMDSAEVLAQLEKGQVDAGVFLSHPKADDLDNQGLIYDRHSLARTDVLLLGPVDDLAGIRNETDPARALSQVLAANQAGAAVWQPPVAGSALAGLADQLTQGLSSKGMGTALSKIKAKQSGAAYRLMTKADWLKHPPKGERLKIWLSGAPRLTLDAQVACSFRVRHPGAKLLVTWLQWPLAQSAIKASKPAWQSVKG